MPEFILEINRENNGVFDLAGNGYTKFADDCINHEDSNFFVFLTGVVFNKSEILEEHNKSDWFDCIISLYQANGDAFFTVLKGSYNGTLYDKRKKTWVVFSNFQGEKPLFSCVINSSIIISSSINEIKLNLEKQGKKLSLSKDGAYMLLSFSFMLEDHTLFNEVKRLKAGYYYTINSGAISEHRYFNFFSEQKINTSEEEIIENIDLLFNKAVNIQYNKNIEYGYHQIANLSGGLDSRMTVWCANKLGHKNQLNLTYGQTGSADELIAKQVAADLKHEWLFKALDNGNFLEIIDEMMLKNGGCRTAYVSAKAFSMLRLLDLNDFGVIHNGELGDVVLGWQREQYRNAEMHLGAYSEKLIHRISKSAVDISEYQSDEEFLIRNRYINGINYPKSFNKTLEDSFSPFYDTDFWSYCLTIPLKFRYKHRLYKKWILKKYPEAAQFKWEKTNVPVDYKIWRDGILFHKGRKVSVSEIAGGFFRRVARKMNIKHKPSLDGMNPYNQWYQINNDLRLFMQEYFDDHIELLNIDVDVKKDAEHLFKTGQVREKMDVLSLLSAIKIYLT